MVKLTGPGLSIEASGTVGNILTFGKTKGRAIVRKKPVPSQPRSGLQVSMRAMMKFISQQWKNLTAGEQATWANAYDDPGVNNYNAYIRHNLERWRSRRPPSKVFPATEVNDVGLCPQITTTGGVRHAKLDLECFISARDNWTILVFHKFEAPAASDVDQLIHVELVEDTLHHYWTHTPLKPGIHHYRINATSNDGKVYWSDYFMETAVIT